MGLKAYLLWEQNGRPEGGDFSQQAREMLTEAMRSGRTITQIEKDMKGVGPAPLQHPGSVVKV